ncbi:MAG TPA: glutamate racemase [Clostridia bacterium]|nr:MAG: Glutamate racemase [Firmicutes bacterium ADurb.Bin146]HOD92564.1 glutamate racemase [Clostridia bacterium]HQM39222.1 glutamate racemase [Clostridia bacterium]
MTDGKIGVFDSGIGGLTVLKEIINYLPNEDIIYFGDGKRTPYGGKSKETIELFALQSMKFLVSKGTKAVVIACNTVSSNAMDAIRANYSIPVIGVVSTTAQLAFSESRNKKIGVIGTKATIESCAYEKALKSIDKSVYVYQKSCPLFVPLAEEGIEWWDDEITEMVAKRYFKFFNNTDIDTLILGCTHYPLLKKIIKRTIGDNVNLVDSALITARKTKVMLEQAKLLTTDKKKGSLEIYTSDSIERFLPLCSAILGMNNINIQKCDVGE